MRKAFHGLGLLVSVFVLFHSVAASPVFAELGELEDPPGDICDEPQMLELLASQPGTQAQDSPYEVCVQAKGKNPLAICGERCLKKLSFDMKSFQLCVDNCLNGRPLGCGNGNLEKGEDCKTCKREVQCKASETCDAGPGYPVVHTCNTCGDGICSPSENMFMGSNPCPIDCNGKDGCNAKNTQCGFQADCRCPGCQDKGWIACRSDEVCAPVGRKYECVAKK